MKKAIETKAELKRAIKSAKEVYVRVTFGTLEHDAKITKAEAMVLLNEIEDDATPESMEMFGSSFGFYEPSMATLWIG